ncbi:MAG: DPP IV N-terminal domain-containing protein [Gemmatimonadota bacterium]
MRTPTSRSSTATAGEGSRALRGRRRCAACLAASLLLPVAASPIAAQIAEGGLTVRRIYGTADFEGESFSVVWRSDGKHWTAVEKDAAGDDELWQTEAITGARELLVSAEELVPAGAAGPIEIEQHAFSSDGRRVLIFTETERVWRDNTRGTYYVFDLQSRILQLVGSRPGGHMFAKFSPDGSRVAFVRDNDIFVFDLASGEERRLTYDGSETIINGTTDWVYEEELSLRDAFQWSPDGQRIAYWRFDQSPLRAFYLLDESSLYPSLTRILYPKAGERNSIVRVGSLEVASGETTWFDTGAEEDVYVARMEWAESSEEVLIQRLNRHQNHLDVLLGDARTGETHLLFSETDDAWVEVRDDLEWIENGRRFVWTSERDGYRHLYMYEREGRLFRQITRGEWDVTSFHGVDQRAGLAYFTAAMHNPVTRSVYAVSLTRSTAPKMVAGGRGVHEAEFSPDFRLFLDRHSKIGTPPRTVLRRADGSEVRVVSENAELAARVDSLGLREPEFITVSAADGTPLNAYILKPPDFDPGHAYPLLMYVYGGPGSQRVLDQWSGSRYLWHQMLVQRGILVACVDNRGTGGRGRDFTRQVYLRLGQLETADQVAAARELGALPYIDESRIGIWGWSYGGYITLLALLEGEGTFAAGVSVAPVTAWELYDTIYTERYMRTPAENPDGYRAGTPLTRAAKLESAVLIVHGTGDDNVHAQHTIRMVEALEEASKQFDMRLYPSKTHSLSGRTTRVNLYEMITRFVMRELGGEAARPAS